MKKILIFPRLHKIPHPPKVNFGIFKQISHLPTVKKNKSVKFKNPEKKSETPKEKKKDILKEDYSYVEETTFSFKNKDSLLKTKPKNLYERLVLEKMKPNKTFDNNNSSSSSSDLEEKKINETTINKIKIFPDYETTISNKYYPLINKLDEQKKEKKDLKNEKKVQFMLIKEDKENIQQFLDRLIEERSFLFKKNFIPEYIFHNINEEVFIQKLNEEMNKKKEEIPFYLYEDDEYLKGIFDETSIKIILEELEKNKYLYNRNEVILPQVIDYHNYLKEFGNMYNSIGGKISLDDLYNKEIYNQNQKEKEQKERQKEKQLIENIIQNKKKSAYQQKNNKKPSGISFYKTDESNSKIYDKNLFDTDTSNNEKYKNIINKVIQNEKKFNTNFEHF